MSKNTNSRVRQGDWDGYWRASAETAGQLTSVDRALLATLREWCGNPAERSFLEAGSGSGKISCVLAAEGADASLVDLSREALDLSREVFRGSSVPATFVRGSILDLPFNDEGFDVVWNEGVVEHFDRAARMRIVKEMARVCRPEGWVITFAPYAGAHLYRLGKWVAEKRDAWVFGREEPLSSMRPEFRAAGLTVVDEKSIAFWGQVHFLVYIPLLRVIPRLTACVEPRLEFFDRLLPGYFLATAGRKR